MRRLAWIALVAGCGGSPSQPVLANRPTGPADPTCRDAGTILRGRIDEISEAAKAGTEREQAITTACEHDRWSAAVIGCIAGGPHPDRCLDRLSGSQRASYEDKLQAWAERWGGAGYGGDAYGGDVYGVAGDDSVACKDAISAAGAFPPALSLTGDDESWAETMRRGALEKLCNSDSWDEDIKACVQTAIDTAAIGPCLDKLEPDERLHVVARLAEVDTIATKLATARKKPADCKHVVAAHYADAQWQSRLDQIKGSARKKMIAESRDRMTKACMAEKWSDTLRTCIALGGNEDCFAAGGAATTAWGYPADGVTLTSGIVECEAYRDAILRLSSCQAIPQASRDALLDSFKQVSSTWANVAADQRSAVVTACKAGAAAINQSRTALCP